MSEKRFFGFAEFSTWVSEKVDGVLASVAASLGSKVDKTDDFGQYKVGELELSVLLADLASGADLATLQQGFNDFVAAKASTAEAIAGTDDAKYLTAVGAKAAIEAAVNDLVGSAPEAMNTIMELATALENNPDVISELTTLVGQKLDEAQVQAVIDTALTGKGIGAALDMRPGTPGEALYITVDPASLKDVGVVHGYVKGSQLGFAGILGNRYGLVSIYGQVVDDLGATVYNWASVRREFQHSGGQPMVQYLTRTGAGSVEDPYVYSWGEWSTMATTTSTVRTAQSTTVIQEVGALISPEPATAYQDYTTRYPNSGTASFVVFVGENADATGTPGQTLVIPGISALLNVTPGAVTHAIMHFHSNVGGRVVRIIEVEGYTFMQSGVLGELTFGPWKRVGAKADDSAKLEGVTKAGVIAEAVEAANLGTIASSDIYVSTVDPLSTDGKDGDLWIKYTP